MWITLEIDSLVPYTVAFGMKKVKIVMDTNVLYAGLYSSLGASHKILRFIQAGIIVPVLSPSLLFEYEEILLIKQEILALSRQQIDVVLDNLCALGMFQKIHFLWRPYLKDAKDDHVLEVTVASGVQVIVTFNVKDFIGCEKFGIQALPPAKILEKMQ